MSTRERILMIRLMEKLEKHPAYVKALGVEVSSVVHYPSQKTEAKGLADA